MLAQKQQRGNSMLINIKNLSKNKVFAALYNVDKKPGMPKLSDAEAQTILDQYHAHVGNCGRLYFDYFDASQVLEGPSGFHSFGLAMKIDLTTDFINPERYDSFHGQGKVEELVNKLRKERVKEIEDLLYQYAPGTKSDNIKHLLLTGDEKLEKDFPDLDKILNQYFELKIEIQNYEKVVDLKNKLDKSAKQQHQLFAPTGHIQSGDSKNVGRFIK